jgi:o-succinylbenzoate---CoA ligase
LKTPNWLAASARAFPGRVALIAAGEHLSYGDLEERAASDALRLRTLGVGEGDRVALVLEASAEYVVLLHAVIKLGAVAVPLDPDLGPAELDSRLERIGPRLVITDTATVAEARQSEGALVHATELDAVQCVIHTSGSGGRAKAIELTYGNQLWSALGSAGRIGVDPHDRWLCCLPLHHIGGLAIVLRSAIYGTGIALTRFETDSIRELVEKEAVTLASLVATTLTRLLDAKVPLERLRCVLLGGGPLPADLVARAQDAGVPVAPTYGLTEAASQVTTLAPDQATRLPGSVGTPILPTVVEIGEDGRILVSGPTVAPALTEGDGRLRTGDMGRLDDAGNLYVLGRADEVIVTGGENVSPEEVEHVLVTHPDVADAAVAGRDDPQWQQAVIAAVVLQEGAAADESKLRMFCRERLAGYKVPKEFVFVNELPRDAQGKLRRRALAAGLASSGSGTRFD